MMTVSDVGQLALAESVAWPMMQQALGTCRVDRLYLDIAGDKRERILCSANL